MVSLEVLREVLESKDEEKGEREKKHFLDLGRA